jgi:hypothetical protein
MLEKNRSFAEVVVQLLVDASGNDQKLLSLPPGLMEAEKSRRFVVDQGFGKCPTGEETRLGTRPPENEEREAGEWSHGWQYHASVAVEKRFVQRDLLSHLEQSQRTMLLSQSGPNAGRFLSALPTAPETTFGPGLMEVAIKRRLELPLPILTEICEGTHCSKRIDSVGDHRANCMRTGRVQKRAKPMEIMWARVFREAGARVKPSKMLNEMNLGVPANDLRRIDFIAYGLPAYTGLPIAGDSSMVSPVTGDGKPINGRAATHPGEAIHRREQVKYEKYHEFHSNRIAPQAYFIPLVCEVGGRWGDICGEVVRLLAKGKSRDAPACLGKSVEYAFLSRWWAMLSVTAQSALAASLLDTIEFNAPDELHPTPPLDTVLHSTIYSDGPQVSRIGAA